MATKNTRQARKAAATVKGKTTGLTFKEFVKRMVRTNKAETGYAGLHSFLPIAWADNAGFNGICAEEFSVTREEVVAATRKMAEAGEIIALPARPRGVRFYLPEDAPTMASNTPSASALSTVAKLLK